MIDKMLVITDIHLGKDITTLGNSEKITLKIIDDLINYIEREEIDYITLTGDVFHQGYNNDVHMAISHYNAITNLLRAPKKGSFLVGGNHAFLKKETNLENYIAQPSMNTTYAPAKPIVKLRNPMCQMLDEAIIQRVQFSFHHYNKRSKDYVNQNSAIMKKAGIPQIAIYHDYEIIPPSYTNGHVQSRSVIMSDSRLLEIFKYVDVAIFGDLHSELEPFIFGGTRFIVPGSILPTSNKDLYFANETVKLPLIEIEGTTFNIKFVEFKRYLNQLDRKIEEIKKERIKPLKLGNQQLIEDPNIMHYVNRNELPKEILRIFSMAYSQNLDPTVVSDIYDSYKGDKLANMELEELDI